MAKHAKQTGISFLAYAVAALIMVLPLPAIVANHILIIGFFLTLLLVVLAKRARQSGKDCIFLRTLIFSSLLRLAAYVNIFRIILQGKGDKIPTISYLGEAVAGQNLQLGILISALNGIILSTIISNGMARLNDLKNENENNRPDYSIKIQNIRLMIGNELIAYIILGLASIVFGYYFAVFMRLEDPKEAFEHYIMLTCGFAMTMNLSLILANLAICFHFFTAPNGKGG